MLALSVNAHCEGEVAIAFGSIKSSVTAYWQIPRLVTQVNALSNATNNTSVGFDALFANTAGCGNTVVGKSALRSNTTLCSGSC